MAQRCKRPSREAIRIDASSEQPIGSTTKRSLTTARLERSIMSTTATEIYRTPDERFDRLPGYDFAPHYAEMDGLRLHYLDEGGRDDAPLVCFHGEPTWAFLYRKMIPPLVAAGQRVICPDYAGFGRSDKPTDRRWYTYDRHVELVARLLDGLDLSGATVVVQDWGGPIGLRWAVEHADRVARLVILNTGIFTGRVSKGFLAWRDFAEKNPDLPIGFVIQGATKTELPSDVLAGYEAPFPTPESKAGAAQFPLLVPTEDDAPGAGAMRAVADALSIWEKPALIAFSDADPVFPHPKSGEVFRERIPGALPQVTISGAAHFLQEDKGEQIAQEMLAFLGA
jgi:haloalkane dehalogenase